MPRAARAIRNEHVQEQLKTLPDAPGCYIYRDEKGNVLYVGKAIVLKNRVRSYFQPSAKHGPRIERLVHRVRDIETIVVDSEIEALVLECNLIKRYRPPFNVRMRDDKSYPYIVITNEAFPRVLFTRQVRKDKAKYFGPYPNSYAVRDTLQLLHKVFPLIPCGKSFSGDPVQRPCLYYHLGQCLAPCAGLASRIEYDRVLDRVARFLGGKETTLIEEMTAEMEAAAEELDFELAAKRRDQIRALESVQQRQKVNSAEGVDQDVVALVKDERGAAIQMLYIRDGKLLGQKQFALDGAKEVTAGEAIGEFLKQYYNESPEVPREVLLPIEIEERQIVQSWLRQQRGSAVTLEVPQGGEKLRLVEMAAANAEQSLAVMASELAARQDWADQAMDQLQESLGLPSPPLRVEGYDISNIQGTSPVSSMVVVENGDAAKDQYRRFKIRYHPESPNDFAMMHETIFRRLKAALDGDEKFSKLPDLIMIDGGKGQLGAALKARDELGLSIPMVGLAKRLELIYVPIEIARNADVEPMREYSYDRPAAVEYAFREVELPLQSPGLLLLRKLRDEAHRFALTYHRKLRDKRTGGSVLDEIPGIGPRRKRLLLRTFGSVEAIRRATIDDIAAVPTMTKAQATRIHEFLNDST